MMLTRGFAPAARALGLRRRALLRAELVPQPAHRAVGALPLVLVDGARQEALDARSLRRHAAADHLGDRAGDDDARQLGIERRVRALHRAFGAVAAELLLRQAGDDDRQLVRRQGVGVVQHRGDRQVLAADRAVDDDLQSLDGGEDIDRAPVAAGPVVVEDQHHAHLLGRWLRPSACRPGLELGPVARRVLPDAGRVALRRRRRRRRSFRRTGSCSRARR